MLLHARFRHTAGFLSLIVAYAATENADTSVSAEFIAVLTLTLSSEHFPVLATLKLKLKRSTQPQTKYFIPNLSSLSNIDVSREYAANVSSKLRAASLEDQTLEAMWGHYKSALDFAGREVLGKHLCAKKPWIVVQRGNSLQGFK